MGNEVADNFIKENKDKLIEKDAAKHLNKFINSDQGKKISKKVSESDDIPEIISDVTSLMLHNQAPTDIFLPCNSKAIHCQHFKCVSETLQKYHKYAEKQRNDEAKNDIYRDVLNTDQHQLVNILNDYQHLLFRHKIEFEDIFIAINKQIYKNAGCDKAKCELLRRNRRDRAAITDNESILNALYHDSNIIEQELLDIIHCYFMHSFDSGYRLLSKTREILTANEEKLNDDTHTVIRNLLKLKRNLLTATSSKFNTIDYSFGHRFYYHDYYKENQNTYDDAAPISITHHKDGDETKDDAVCEMYISPIHGNFQEELLNNELCKISKSQWDRVWGKCATYYIMLDQAKDMQCVRETNGSAKCYKLQKGDPVQVKHLMALKLYTDYDNLQRVFSSTFRLQHNETMEELKKRHSNYYHWSKHLRECIEGFGMRCRKIKDQDGKEKKSFTVYHGVNQQMAFSTVYPYIKGPFSTSESYAVAVNFCNNSGMILELDINIMEWQQKLHIKRSNYMEGSWISDYPHEQEILFCGGLNRHIFNNIIDATLGVNYEKYVKALRQMTYCTTNWNFSMDMLRDSRPETKEEKQMIWRLMSHEFNRYSKFENIKLRNGTNLANEWKECPEYIKKMMHEHCLHIRAIAFYDKLMYDKENLIFKTFFKMNNGWITLDRITTIFPHLQVIVLNIEDPKIMKEAFDSSILPFIKQEKQVSLKLIGVRMESKHKQEMEKMINFMKDTKSVKDSEDKPMIGQNNNNYIKQFDQHGWRLRVRDIEFDKWITELDVDLGAMSSELGDFMNIMNALNIENVITDSINKLRDRLGIEIEIKKIKE